MEVKYNSEGVGLTSENNSGKAAQLHQSKEMFTRILTVAELLENYLLRSQDDSDDSASSQTQN